MPLLRSREVIYKPPLRNPPPIPPPLDPSTPARSDAPPATSSPSPSSALDLRPDPSPSVPERRRSLRLASLSSLSPEPPMDAHGRSDKRKRVDRVSSSPTNERYGGESGVSADARVLGVASDFPVDEEIRASNVNVDPVLPRSTPKRRGIEVASVEKGKEKLEEKDGEMGRDEVRALEAVVPFQGDGDVRASDVDVELVLSLASSARSGSGSAVKRRVASVEKGKGKLVLEAGSLEKGSSQMVIDIESSGNEGEAGGEQITSGRRFSTEEEGKGKLVIEKDWLSIGHAGVPLDKKLSIVEGGDLPNRVGSVQRRNNQRMTNTLSKKSRREANMRAAVELAPKFAFFKPEEEEKDEEPEEPVVAADQDTEDWPGPFNTALKLIEEREGKLKIRELNFESKRNEPGEVRIHWSPSKDQKRSPAGKPAPFLKDLCLKILSENVEEIESLEGVPDVLKNTLVSLVCHSRKMSGHVLDLITSDRPIKVQLHDCSWATEEQIAGALAKCKTENLKVLQLDMCGRCMTDYVLRATLAQSLNCLPALTTLSLKGAYRLSDDGINTIVSSMPALSSVNLSQCSLLTANGITSLADKLDSVLRELYIDDCQNVDAMLILPALKKLKCLELLSVARIQTVCDKFVKNLLSFSGQNMKKLVFAGCCRLTSASMKIVGERCFRLSDLDLQYLNRLDDSAVGYVANGCGLIQKLTLRRNRFSDEAVAAFLEACGGSLTELSLNNVEKVAENSAIAISKRCSSRLSILDLSFCRMVSDEALGLIVDSCSSLNILKLFGCSQVSEVFLNGHSNSQVKIIGLEGKPILEQIDTQDFKPHESDRLTKSNAFVLC